jgi:glycerol-3-phosphate acyltransferase PlsX
MEVLEKIRVTVDAMGSDNAPHNEVLGSIEAASERKDLEIILVGRENEIRKVLEKQNYQLGNLSVVNADEVVTMEDNPSEAYKQKPNSSINIALNLQLENKADAFISAGNTGAVLASSTLKLGRIEGISRPTIGSMFPSEKGNVMLFDVGATVDCRANNLVEYALMGSVYSSYILGVENPKVGLLSVGEENTKGNELTLEAYELLSKSGLNFVGNVEGGDILKGKVDVVVCDGFVGNIILKFAESVLGLLKAKFRKLAESSLINKFKVGMAQSTLRQISKEFDYQYYGGVPLLGVNGVSIIGHGKSTPLAIKNMIFRAEETVRKRVNDRIKAVLKNRKINNNKNIK